MKQLKYGDTIGLIALSNGLDERLQPLLIELERVVNEMGLQVKWAPKRFKVDSVYAASDEERANMLMDFYRDDEIKVIFDISGGDLANGVLPYLDIDLIKNHPKSFFGYSDLTVVLNALHHQTKQKTYLYQIRNLVGEDAKHQQKRFIASLLEGQASLFDFSYEWIQGSFMNGEVVGGNIRCLLKLAGTKNWPDMKGKLLFLESYSGDVAKMATYLNQYRQLGVFDEINGLILGHFTEMQSHCYQPDIVTLVKNIVSNPNLPIIKTDKIGHGADSKCLVIGKSLTLGEQPKESSHCGTCEYNVNNCCMSQRGYYFYGEAIGDEEVECEDWVKNLHAYPYLIKR